MRAGATNASAAGSDADDGSAQLPAAHPYAPSWLHALIDLIERLPGPTWATYLVVAVVSILLVHSQLWSTGQLPLGGIDSASVYYGILPVALIWTAGYLERVAAGAFDAFRPALSLAAPEVARLRYELTILPARPSLVITGAAIAVTVLTWAIDPVAAGVTGMALPLLVGRFVLESLNTVILVLLTYQLLRQMRDVRRTLARSTVVDLFQPGPLYAFSKLTSRTGMALVLLIVSSLVFVPLPVESDTFLITWAPWLVLPPVIAAFAFLVPLYGMHGRLVDEKERLQDEAEERLKGILAELNNDVDARDLRRADALNKTLLSMMGQRDILAKLPTWPWSTGTFRAFLTAILLPLGLFVVQRLLAQFV